MLLDRAAPAPVLHVHAAGRPPKALPAGWSRYMPPPSFSRPARLTTLPRTTETPLSCTATPKVRSRGLSGVADSARAKAWASSTPASQSTHRLQGETLRDRADTAGAAPDAAIIVLLIYDVLHKGAKGV